MRPFGQPRLHLTATALLAAVMTVPPAHAVTPSQRPADVQVEQPIELQTEPSDPQTEQRRGGYVFAVSDEPVSPPPPEDYGRGRWKGLHEEGYVPYRRPPVEAEPQSYLDLPWYADADRDVDDDIADWHDPWWEDPAYEDLDVDGWWRTPTHRK